MVPFLPIILSIVINNNILEKWRTLAVIYIRQEYYDAILKLGKDPKTFIHQVLEKAIKELEKELK